MKCWTACQRGRRLHIIGGRRPSGAVMYPLVLDLAADQIPVAVTRRVLGFSPQAFYI